MSDDEKTESANSPEDESSAAEPAQEQPTQNAGQDGPKFTQGPDPLAGVKKGAGDVMATMEGKTVSMKVYVGSIIAVIVLMLLGRCSG